mmetsp:Transcript_40927/g.96116  ORF Transcript_40927/g.96116 Transcript_40927/m.96116 type:complete len:314 (-) Transcript_40927:15-956(-)
MLSRCDLVVDDGHWAAEGQHHLLDAEEQLVDGVWHRREVVQVRLLIAAGQLSEESAAGVHQVWSLLVEVSRDHEELLLPSEEGVHLLGVGSDANGLQKSESLSVHGVVGAQQRSLVVNRRTEMRDEGARNAQHTVEDEARRRTVPRGEGCSCVRGSQTSIGEGRAVGLAKEEALVRQHRLEGLGCLCGRPFEVNECVHLEGANCTAWGTTSTTHWEEPVGKGDCAKFSGPLEHDIGQDLHVRLARGSSGDESILEAAVHVTGQLGLHGGIVEDCGRSVGQCVRHFSALDLSAEGTATNKIELAIGILLFAKMA